MRDILSGMRKIIAEKHSLVRAVSFEQFPRAHCWRAFCSLARVNDNLEDQAPFFSPKCYENHFLVAEVQGNPHYDTVISYQAMVDHDLFESPRSLYLLLGSPGKSIC